MSHQKRLCSGIAFCIIASLGIRAFGAIPGADNPKAYTEHDYRKQLLEFNHRTIVDAYQQVGHHDPKWDDAANKFLEAMAVELSDSDAEPMYRLPTARPSHDEIESLGRAAIAAGCDDPLVRDLFCAILEMQDKTDEMRPILRKNLDSLVQSHYPAHRIAEGIRRAIRITNPALGKSLLAKYAAMLHDADLASVKSNDWKGPVDRRIVMSGIRSDMAMRDENRPLDVDKEAALYNDAKNSGGDEWMTDMIGGRYHFNAAWKARGGGTGNTLTQQQRQGYATELAAASECLQAASKLQPDYPEAASDIIGVATGQNDRAALRNWFNKSVQAQFDFLEAYETYIYALQPSWLGNQQMMYAFGKECAATNRYDTRVPEILLLATDDADGETGGTLSFWRIPGVFESAREVLTHYAESPALAARKGFYYSELAGRAWELHRYDDAKAALDKVGEQPDADGMLEAHAIAARATAGIAAMTGDSKDELKKAESAQTTGDIDSAIAAYDAAKQSLKPNDPASVWIRGRDQELHWEKQFATGTWVNLVPTDPDAPGWWNNNGKLTSDGQSISGEENAKDRTLAICGSRFGESWELHLKMQLAPLDTGGEVPKLAEIGPVFCWHPPKNKYELRLRPVGQSGVWIDTDVAPFYMPKYKLSETPVVDVAMFDGKGTVSIDGKPWLKNNDFWLCHWFYSRIGFTGSSPAPGAKFIITDLKIRKLTAPPTAAAKAETNPAG